MLTTIAGTEITSAKTVAARNIVIVLDLAGFGRGALPAPL